MIVLFIFVCLIVVWKWWSPFVSVHTDCDIRDIRHFTEPLRTRFETQSTDTHVGQGGRKSITLVPTSNKALYERLDTLLPGYHVRRDIPVEFRLYYTGSVGMDWHRDERLAVNTDYIEGVLTLRNDSDSVFEYMLGPFIKKRVVPHEGTLVLIKPDDLLHRVTPVHKGSREILKMVLSPNNKIGRAHV